MQATTRFELLDRLLEGRLADELLGQRAQGASYEDIARSLEAVHGVKVTATTVWRWVRDIEVRQAS